jgi:hypothetical protein
VDEQVFRWRLNRLSSLPRSIASRA